MVCPGSLLGCHQSGSVLCHLDELCHFANDFQLKGWGHMVMSSFMLCASTLWNKRMLINSCPNFCLGVDIGFLGFEDCAGVCCSPMMGLTLI